MKVIISMFETPAVKISSNDAEINARWQKFQAITYIQEHFLDVQFMAWVSNFHHLYTHAFLIEEGHFHTFKQGAFAQLKIEQFPQHLLTFVTTPTHYDLYQSHHPMPPVELLVMNHDHQRASKIKAIQAWNFITMQGYLADFNRWFQCNCHHIFTSFLFENEIHNRFETWVEAQGLGLDQRIRTTYDLQLTNPQSFFIPAPNLTH